MIMMTMMAVVNGSSSFPKLCCLSFLNYPNTNNELNKKARCDFWGSISCIYVTLLFWEWSRLLVGSNGPKRFKSRNKIQSKNASMHVAQNIFAERSEMCGHTNIWDSIVNIARHATNKKFSILMLSTPVWLVLISCSSETSRSSLI